MEIFNHTISRCTIPNKMVYSPVIKPLTVVNYDNYLVAIVNPDPMYQASGLFISY